MDAPKVLATLRSGSLPWRVLEKGLVGKAGWDWVVDAIAVSGNAIVDVGIRRGYGGETDGRVKMGLGISCCLYRTFLCVWVTLLGWPPRGLDERDYNTKISDVAWWP